MYVYVCMYVCVYEGVYACVCVCVCVYVCVMYDACEALLNWHGLALEHLTTCRLRSAKEDLTTIRGFTLHLPAV